MSVFDASASGGRPRASVTEIGTRIANDPEYARSLVAGLDEDAVAHLSDAMETEANVTIVPNPSKSAVLHHKGALAQGEAMKDSENEAMKSLLTMRLLIDAAAKRSWGRDVLTETRDYIEATLALEAGAEGLTPEMFNT